MSIFQPIGSCCRDHTWRRVNVTFPSEVMSASSYQRKACMGGGEDESEVKSVRRKKGRGKYKPVMWGEVR